MSVKYVPAFRLCHISKYLTLPNLVWAGIAQCATGWTAGVRIPVGVRFFSSQRADRLWEPTQPPIQWVLWTISPGVKLSEREAEQSI
jgi:hypothetical protein